MTNLPVKLPTNTLIKDGFDLLKRPKSNPVAMKILENKASMISGALEIGNGLINLGNNYIDYKKVEVNVYIEEYKYHQEKEKTKQVEIESNTRKHEAILNHENVLYQCQVKQQEYLVELENIKLRKDKFDFAKEVSLLRENEYKKACEFFGVDSPQAKEILKSKNDFDKLIMGL
jgi:hypothetical protein